MNIVLSIVKSLTCTLDGYTPRLYSCTHGDTGVDANSFHCTWLLVQIARCLAGIIPAAVKIELELNQGVLGCK